jgi:hypothetical protein
MSFSPRREGTKSSAITTIAGAVPKPPNQVPISSDNSQSNFQGRHFLTIADHGETAGGRLHVTTTQTRSFSVLASTIGDVGTAPPKNFNSPVEIRPQKTGANLKFMTLGLVPQPE